FLPRRQLARARSRRHRTRIGNRKAPDRAPWRQRPCGKPAGRRRTVRADGAGRSAGLKCGNEDEATKTPHRLLAFTLPARFERHVARSVTSFGHEDTKSRRNSLYFSSSCVLRVFVSSWQKVRRLTSAVAESTASRQIHCNPLP